MRKTQMNPPTGGCASQPTFTHWNSINWKKVGHGVKSLQRRIVKAIKAKHFHKVKTLVHLLTRSFYGKLLAILRITTNRGSKTCGVDKVIRNTCRPKRSCADAIQQCHNALSQRKSAQWVLEPDIKGCFDNISHDWILQNILLSKEILSQWLKAGYIDNKNWFPTESGTPQGGIISPTIANMVLDGLETTINRHAVVRRNRNPHKIHFIRYADDFVVTCPLSPF